MPKVKELTKLSFLQKIEALKKVEAKPLTLFEKIEKAHQEKIKTVGAILTDYMAGTESMIIEIAAADETFIDEMEVLIEDEQDFESVIKRLKYCRDNDDIDERRVIDLIEPDIAVDWLIDKGFTVIKGQNLATVQTNSLRDQMKLEEFLHTLYPMDSDFEAYVNI
jgi:hypothetical protein